MKIITVLFSVLISFPAISQDEVLKTDWANMKKYAVENRNLKPAVKGENRIVFMGNSITESWKTINSSFFYNTRYINRGIGGQTTPQMLVRFRADVIALKPAVVVILAGINDIAENTGPVALEDIYGNIISMVQLAKANNIKVVLSSVLPANAFSWRPALKPAEKIIILNAMLLSYCRSNNIVFVDYYSKMVDNEMGLSKKFTKDGVHPTIEGYKIMEPLVEQGIKNALQQKL